MFQVKKKLKSNQPVTFAKPGPAPSSSSSDNTKKNLKDEQESSLTPVQKKEYLLVPKYKGFKVCLVFFIKLKRVNFTTFGKFMQSEILFLKDW